MHSPSRSIFGERIVVQDADGTLEAKSALIQIENGLFKSVVPVSYTHLTLPTICSV